MKSDRRCPICYSNNKKNLYHQTFSAISSVSLITAYDVVSCTDCGFCFADNIPNQIKFDIYYQELSKYESNENIPIDNKYDILKFQDIFSFLSTHLIDRNIKIVEIGCATGLLLSILKKEGFKNLLGVDPSGTCTKTVEKLYQIPVLTDTLSTLNLPMCSVDLIVLIGVLEHIYDLEISLKKLWRILSDNGQILISVPDASKYFTGSDAPFQEFSLEHINYFGPISLDNLMVRSGFVNLQSKQTVLEIHRDTITPVLHSIYQKKPRGENILIKSDDITTPNLVKYIDKSRNEDLLLKQKIEKIVDSERPIIIWGTGAQLLRLLETTKIGVAKIVAFVDSNPKYFGKTINGISIISPEDLKSMSEAILITSKGFQYEIIRQIKFQLMLQNEIITLF